MTRRLVPAGVAMGLAVATFAAMSLAAAQTTPPAPASPPVSAAKKELVQRLMRLQQSNIEAMARSLVEQPAAQMMREAGLAMQQLKFPQDKFQTTGKQIETEVKKYIDESYPIVRERAIKIAPSTIGAALEAKMSEDELRQLVAWLDSPVSKKFQQVNAEAANGFAQQVSREAATLIQPKLVALDGRIRVILGVAPAGAAPAASGSAGPAARAK